ncbi:MAG: hypothetical protein ACKV2V_10515 [Blastocatellia bacterium]
MTITMTWLIGLLMLLAGAQTPLSAPGAPGQAGATVNAPREAMGTSVEPDSRVWFTLRGGMLAETAWLRPGASQSRMLMFAVTDGRSFVTGENDPAMVRQLILPNPRALVFRQSSFHPTRRFSLSKTYITSHDSETLLIDVEFNGQPGQQLYVIFDPALAGTDLKDTAAAYGGQGAFVMYEGAYAGALIASMGFDELSAGFQGTTSDGWADLRRNYRLTKQYTRAAGGNVICVARIRRPEAAEGTALRFTMALSFSDQPETALTDAEHALEKDFAEVRGKYEKGWMDWLARQPRPATTEENALNMAAMLLRAQEEKVGRAQIRHGR